MMGENSRVVSERESIMGSNGPTSYRGFDEDGLILSLKLEHTNLACLAWQTMYQMRCL